jgi:hypothetical protein
MKGNGARWKEAKERRRESKDMREWEEGGEKDETHEDRKDLNVGGKEGEEDRTRGGRWGSSGPEQGRGCTGRGRSGKDRKDGRTRGTSSCMNRKALATQ